MTIPPAASPDIATTLHKILRLAQGAIHFDKGAIHLVEGDALWTRAVWSRPDTPVDAGHVGARLPLDEGLCGYVVQRGQPFLSPHVAAEQRAVALPYNGSPLRIQSFLGLPLRWDDQVLGVLEMDSLTPGFFQPQHLDLAEVVADQAAVAIFHAQLAEERRQLIERQQLLQQRLEAQNAALRDSNQQLAALLDATESGILLSDAQGRVAHVNRTLCELLGLERDAALGRPIAEVMAEAAEQFASPTAFRTRSDWLYRHPRAIARDNLTTAGSEPRLYQRYSAPVFADQAEPGEGTMGRVEVYSDVTESRRLEAQMRQYLDEMLTVHRIGLTMGIEQDPLALLQFVCEQAATLVHAQGSAVALLRDEDPERLVVPVICGLEHDGSEERIESVYQSVAGAAILQRRPVTLSNLTGEAAATLRQQWHAGSAVSVPLESRDRVIGALLVFDDEVRRFDDHDVQLLQIFASQAAVTIENTRLLEVAQRRRADLEALTDYNNLLIESSPVGIAVINRAGQFVRANPAFAAIVGAEGESLQGRRLGDLLPEAERRRLQPLIEAAQQQAPQRVTDFLYPHPTRGALWLDLAFSPLRDSEGAVRSVMMTVSDNTARKQLEADLRQRNERINRQLAHQRALHELGTQINAEMDLQRLLQTLMESIRFIFRVDGLSLMMPDEEGAFRPVRALGLSDRYLAEEAASHATSAGGLAVRQRAPVLVADIAEDARARPLRAAARAEGLCSALFLPLVYRNEVVALMALYHRQSYRYQLEEMEMLSIFASQATSAIKNAQFYSSIAQSQGNLNAILQSMTDGVIALDQHDRVIFVNDPLFELLGLPPRDDWIGRSLDELWPKLRELWKRAPGPTPLSQTLAEADGVVAVEVETRDPVRTLELVHAPIVDAAGQHVGRLLLLHDITQIRANERMKDELIAILSHELRTPLTSILGYSKLLVDRPNSDPAKRARWAQHILDKSRLLNRLINEVLDLSRLNMERFDIEVRATDLSELVRRLCEEQQRLAQPRPLQVEVEEGLAEVPVDTERVEQLLLNLLTNAVKYSPETGGITVRLRRDEPWVVLEVSDQGIGIAPEFHERIFEPFFRVDNSTTRAAYGTGLGLPLCRGIAQAHGGDISVESAPDQGSTFRVRLPLTQRS